MPLRTSGARRTSHAAMFSSTCAMLVAPMISAAENQRPNTKASAMVAGDSRVGGQAPRRPSSTAGPTFGLAWRWAKPSNKAPSRARADPTTYLPDTGCRNRAGIRQQRDVLTEAHLGQRGFIGPVEQVVGVLNRHHARQAVQLRLLEELGHPQGCSFERPTQRTLPSRTSSVSASSCLAIDTAARSLLRVELVLAEHRRVPLRPVDLVAGRCSRYAVAAARFYGTADVLAIERQRAAAYPLSLRRGPAILVATMTVTRLARQPGSDDLLATPMVSAATAPE